SSRVLPAFGVTHLALILLDGDSKPAGKDTRGRVAGISGAARRRCSPNQRSRQRLPTRWAGGTPVTPEPGSEGGRRRGTRRSPGRAGTVGPRAHGRPGPTGPAASGHAPAGRLVALARPRRGTAAR